MLTATLCATAGCGLDATGKSKYCPEHKAAARAAWLDRVKKSGEERKGRYELFEKILAEANIAGHKAYEEARPTPMIVQEHTNVADDDSPVKKEYFVSEGVCGFAWVHFTPATSSFSRWLKKNTDAGKSYYGGLDLSVHGSQSYERKMAAARAMAEVFQKYESETKTSAYATGRLD